jgi:hypothetical protein
MNGYYQILQVIKDALLNDNDVNTVTQGDINEVDLNRKDIFNLAHIITNPATFTENTIRFNMSIVVCAIRDINKDINDDKFRNNDNEIDNLNTTLYVCRRLYNKIVHGFDGLDIFEVVGDPSLEPFTEDRENLLDGWVMSFDIDVADNVMCANE